MGGQARGEWSWVSFLLFPHPVHVVGCGWVEHDTRSCGTGSARCWVLRRHLLGGGVFLVAMSGLGRLTHPVCCCGGCGGGCGGWGCGGVLSVA